MKKATFRFIHFPIPNKYIGLAWNYAEAVLVSTTPQDTCDDASNQLRQDCSIVGVELHWYDGEYYYDSQSEQILNRTSAGRDGHMVGKVIAGSHRVTEPS